MNRQGTVDFYGRETICTILQWWIHVITHLSKPVECMTSVRPEANSVLWVIMTCQCRFIICNKCTTVVGDMDSGGGCVCVGTVVILQISVLSPELCCEPKTSF